MSWNDVEAGATRQSETACQSLTATSRTAGFTPQPAAGGRCGRDGRGESPAAIRSAAKSRAAFAASSKSMAATENPELPGPTTGTCPPDILEGGASAGGGNGGSGSASSSGSGLSLETDSEAQKRNASFKSIESDSSTAKPSRMKLAWACEEKQTTTMKSSTRNTKLASRQTPCVRRLETRVDVFVPVICSVTDPGQPRAARSHVAPRSNINHFQCMLKVAAGTTGSNLPSVKLGRMCRFAMRAGGVIGSLFSLPGSAVQRHTRRNATLERMAFGRSC